MSKRTRGARSGRNRPQGRPASAPRPARPVVEAATAVAAAHEAIVEDAPRPATSRVAPGPRTSAKPSGLLATKAANEYVYVERDLRRIGTFAGGILVVMLVLWLLIDVTKVITY